MDTESVWAALKPEADDIEISRFRKWVKPHQVVLAATLSTPLVSHVIAAQH